MNLLPVDGVVFGAMGILILINTLCAAWLFVLLFVRRTALAPAARWGLRLGLADFLVGSGLGMSMIVRGAHAVGVPDGGAGARRPAGVARDDRRALPRGPGRAATRVDVRYSR